MLGGRFKNAISDMAETIRRAFQDPPALPVELSLGTPAGHTVPFLGAQTLAPVFRLEAVLGSVPVLEAAPPLNVDFHWEARLREEEGWGQWSAGAQVCEVPLFRAEKCARLEVPSLPRKAPVRAVVPETFRTRSYLGLEATAAPQVGFEPTGLPSPRSHRALEVALALPVAFTGMDIPKISKALWMRYTLKLVRETGENIRNLEVLGLYRIPTRGTRQINHQAATGRLLVTLGPESLGAPRAPFILARKKDDDSIVCCFVEDV